MNENNTNEKMSFIIELLYNLKKTCHEIDTALNDVEKYSTDFFMKLFYERRNTINGDIDKYKNNLAQIKELNVNITTKINEWYSFVKNPDELIKLLFPVKFHARRSQLNKFIKKANASILQLTIENRLIVEHLNNWEHQLEIEAAGLIKQDVDYKHYEELLRRKDTIIAELKYLLPTVPNLCPVEIDTNNLDMLIEKISKTPAA